MPANNPEQARRDLARWNAARHGLDRFQASNRRNAERIARTAATDTVQDWPEPDDSEENPNARHA